MPISGSCVTMLDARTAGVTPRFPAMSSKATSSFRALRSSPDHLKISVPCNFRVMFPISTSALGGAGSSPMRRGSRFGRDRVRCLLRRSEGPQARRLLLEGLALLLDVPLHVVALTAHIRDRPGRAPWRVSALCALQCQLNGGCLALLAPSRESQRGECTPTGMFTRRATCATYPRLG